ncbi:hypothetical protein [Nocardioides sp.]|uniref:hypothetical protein n=1 Tax=Nocardioides sp. TaxID=35761 RepID=UPI002B270094|nr:hypothetical protein [Nocardioides sp.]
MLDRGLQVQRILGREGAGDVDGAVGGVVALAEVDLEVTVVGGLQPTTLGFVGVEQVDGVGNGALDLRERTRPQGRGQHLVDVAGGVVAEVEGAFADDEGFPHRHLEGHDLFPDAAQSVAELERLGYVGAPAVAAHPEHGGEIVGGELIDQWAPDPAEDHATGTEGGVIDDRVVHAELDRPLDHPPQGLDLGRSDRGSGLTNRIQGGRSGGLGHAPILPATADIRQCVRAICG